LTNLLIFLKAPVSLEGVKKLLQFSIQTLSFFKMKLSPISLARFTLFVGFCSLDTVISTVQPDATDMYFTLDEFHVVQASALQTITVLDSFECLVFCMKNKQCVSVNFAVNSGSDQRFLCQLLTYGSADEKGRKPQHSSEYHHYEKVNHLPG
jgi:hypothetical protein